MENKREYKLPETLRRLMASHPHTGKRTTQKELAAHIGVRSQTLSLYVCGQTAPNAESCLAMANYFGVSVDYLLVGYDDGDLYFAMMDAQQRRVNEKLENIAVLCSNAENLALGLMESEVKPNV